MNTGCRTCLFLSKSHESVLDTEYWNVVLEPNQGYLGQCFVNLKQHKGRLAELSDAEWIDFSNVTKRLEMAIEAAFKPELFNWTCLMNNAFQSDLARPHVHWSVIPRYSRPVNFEGTEFTDPQFGYHYDARHSLELSDNVMRLVSAEIKSYLM